MDNHTGGRLPCLFAFLADDLNRLMWRRRGNGTLTLWSREGSVQSANCSRQNACNAESINAMG